VSYTVAPYPADRPTLHSDLLCGAGQLATWFYGADTRANRRKIYHLTSEVSPERRLPTFRLGDGLVCARISRLLEWIAEQESGGRERSAPVLRRLGAAASHQRPDA
jgi:hypothetical protein